MPGSGLHDAGEDLERGGLARAIGADQAEDLAVADFEIDAAHGLHGAVVLRRDRECEWPRVWRAGSADAVRVPMMDR